MRIAVNIASDVTIGVGVHSGCMPPAPPMPTVSVEMPANQAWPPGMATASHRISRSVTHRCQGIVQGGHDQGPLLLHVTPALPGNILLPADIVGSSRKVAVEASTVTLDGAPAAAAGLAPMALPMLCCSFPISVPAAFPVMNMLNTVTVGLVPMDLLKGALAWATELVIDLVVGRLFKGPAPLAGEQAAAAQEQASSRLERAARKAAEALFPFGDARDVAESLTRWGLTQAAGLAVEAIASESPTYKAELATAHAKLSFGYDTGAGGHVFELTIGPYRLTYKDDARGRAATRQFLAGQAL